MKVSGFTIVKNAVKMGYPAREAIESILPICDQFVVNVGRSEDPTLDLIRAIPSDKIRIIETNWEENLRTGGQVLSRQTNVALQACTGDWAFYLQCDEAIHEKYLDYILDRMTFYTKRAPVEGLIFRYRHFYGSYDYFQDNYRRWYPQEVRIVRRNDQIVSWGDAMGFRHPDGSRLKAVAINAEVYHYGWVKPPEQMLFKKRTLDRYWHDDRWIESQYQEQKAFNYPDRRFLVPFKGSHPAVMQERVEQSQFKLELPKTVVRWYPIRKLCVLFEPLLKRLNIRL